MYIVTLGDSLDEMSDLVLSGKTNIFIFIFLEASTFHASCLLRMNCGSLQKIRKYNVGLLSAEFISRGQSFKVL